MVNPPPEKASGLVPSVVIVLYQAIFLLVVGGFAIYTLLFACSLGGCSNSEISTFLLKRIVPIVVLSVLPVIVIILRQVANPRFGFLIFINLAVELAAWIYLLIGTLKNIFLREIPVEPWFVGFLALSAVGLFLHSYIAVDTITPRSTKKLTLWLTPYALIMVVISGGLTYHYANATRASEWPIYTNWECGYEIKYHPGLYAGGGNAWPGTTCGYRYYDSMTDEGKLAIDILGNGMYFSLEEWLQKGWWLVPASNLNHYFASEEAADARRLQITGGGSESWQIIFNRELPPILNDAKKETINGYSALRFPTMGPRENGSRSIFSVFVSDGGGRVLQATCRYRSDEFLTICNEMISSFKFIFSEDSQAAQAES